MPASFACFKMLRMRLQAAADRLKFGICKTPFSACGSCHGIHHVIRIRRQHRIHHVVVEAEDIAEIKLQALAQEVSYRAAVVNGVERTSVSAAEPR